MKKIFILLALGSVISSNAHAVSAEQYKRTYQFLDRITDRAISAGFNEQWINQIFGRYKDLSAQGYAYETYGAEKVQKSDGWVDNDVRHAWVQGWDGTDVTVNVIDMFNETATRYGGTTSHGGRVSAIIGGGTQFGVDYVGLAPEATVNNIPLFGNAGWGQRHSADIVNYTTTYGLTREMSNPTYIIPQTSALVVASAGNYASTCQSGTGSKDHCSRLATSLMENNADNTLVVGGVHADGRIHRKSGKAGVLQNSFVVDDMFVDYRINEQTRTSEFGNTYTFDTTHKSGTSYSAALVSGKAAIVKSKFPTISNSQLATIIKTTADDLGAPGVDPIFGHGKVNLARALSPVGGLR